MFKENAMRYRVIQNHHLTFRIDTNKAFKLNLRRTLRNVYM